MQHVVVTGRNAPRDLIEIADTVTEMTLVKQAFKAGVKAQPGVVVRSAKMSFKLQVVRRAALSGVREERHYLPAGMG